MESVFIIPAHTDNVFLSVMVIYKIHLAPFWSQLKLSLSLNPELFLLKLKEILSHKRKFVKIVYIYHNGVVGG